MPAGSRRLRTSMAGLLNVAKPEGVTSRRVVDRVLSLVQPAKVGHAGTLDPMATGVLVVCIGAGTRMIPFVQEQRKIYRAEFLFGMRSDTDDVTGQVEVTPEIVEVSRDRLDAALPQFVGTISQVPPQFSAVRVGGKRAHERARRGEEMEISARDVDVYRLDVVEFAWPRLVLEIECGSGTYVRSIGRDLGEVLGCGAVMSGLVRTAIGDFRIEDAIEFDAIDRAAVEAALMPLTNALPRTPRAVFHDDDLARLRRGLRIARPDDLAGSDGDRVLCLSREGLMVAVAEVCEAGAMLQPKLVVPAEKSTEGDVPQPP